MSTTEQHLKQIQLVIRTLGQKTEQRILQLVFTQTPQQMH